jgi:ribonuclease HI
MTERKSPSDVLEEARQLFENAELTLPPVPKELQPALRRVDEWAYASRDITPMDMYMFGRYLVEAVTSDIGDYVAFSHAGHGTNSYAINYHLVLGPLALFVQVGWGGAYMDNQDQARRIKECFSRCLELVEVLRDSERALRWPRLIVAQSELRPINIAAWLDEPLGSRDAGLEWVRSSYREKGTALDHAHRRLRGKASSNSRFVWMPGDLEIVKRSEPEQGFYLLNADGGIVAERGQAAGQAAIGVVLRSPKVVVIAEISKAIGSVEDMHVAEFQALIAGLELARRRGIARIRVYLDSALVVNTINGTWNLKPDHLKYLRAKALGLVKEFADIRLCWVPREMNTEADALASTALPPRPSKE